ncbi:MAG: 2-amino-4-hydroxy-6-hydroxymethyldihydropteridine diphosphokinase [Kiritimatiellae bacterium]|nr:2-amino-4-hydroxy-6-hydroxymethyldihydropteridine diphosphokinase [Kiritimatiellia bacterium]
MEAILSLGSNLGDRRDNLVAACAALAQLPGTRLLASAPIYETDPVDVPAAFRDAAYLNTVIVLETALTPDALSEAAHTIEKRLGRVRGAERNAPRTLDIDLIACGPTVSDRPELRLPHPRALQRRFVVQPLADVRPDLVLPGATHTVREILASLPRVPAVRLAACQWD